MDELAITKKSIRLSFRCGMLILIAVVCRLLNYRINDLLASQQMSTHGGAYAALELYRDISYWAKAAGFVIGCFAGWELVEILKYIVRWFKYEKSK